MKPLLRAATLALGLICALAGPAAAQDGASLPATWSQDKRDHFRMDVTRFAMALDVTCVGVLFRLDTIPDLEKAAKRIDLTLEQYWLFPGATARPTWPSPTG